MRIPMKWLSRYVDLTGVTAEQVAALLTSRGLEIAGIEQLGEDIQNVVVGRIDSITPPPRQRPYADLHGGRRLGRRTADRYRRAPNVKVGDHVPVALHGSHLPGGVKIKKGKLRGVESCGMLCSGEELQLTEHDFPGAGEYGILILREKAGHRHRYSGSGGSETTRCWRPNPPPTARISSRSSAWRARSRRRWAGRSPFPSPR